MIAFDSRFSAVQKPSAIHGLTIFRRLALLLLGLVTVLGSSELVRGALVVQGYEAAKHDRFQNDSAFIGNANDWSGVGRGSGWATMISQTAFLSSTHFHPGNGSSVRFYTSNDPNGAFIDRTVVSGVQIAGSDLWLGTLSESVGPSVNVYPIFSPNPPVFENELLYVFGKSGGDVGGAIETDVRLGRNQIDSVIDDFSDGGLGSSQGDILLFDYDNPGGLGADEAYVAGGDSGAPSFIVVNGEPQIVGIHWFRYTDSEGGVGSGDTLVSSYLSEINIAGGVQVPEPSTIVLVGLLAAIFGSRTRVRRAAVGNT